MLLAISFVSIAFAQKKVAVYAEGEISNDDKLTVCSAVLARMSGNKDYIPYERNEAFVNALDKEQDYQLSGAVPEKEIRAVGERLGVDYVIAVHVSIKKDRVCHMVAKLMNLETGAIVKTVNAQRKFEGTKTITALSNNVAYRLLNKQSK